MIRYILRYIQFLLIIRIIYDSFIRMIKFISDINGKIILFIYYFQSYFDPKKPLQNSRF
jgi:hypothetical protein